MHPQDLGHTVNPQRIQSLSAILGKKDLKKQKNKTIVKYYFVILARCLKTLTTL